MTSRDGREQDQPGRPPVGTVAEEASLLVEALAAFGAGGQVPTGHDAGAGPDATGPDATGPDPTDRDPTQSDDTDSERADSHACTCGGQRPAACAVCPVCQLIAFVQRVRPETIERLADVAELAATGLRDLAVVQRARREQAQPDGRDPAAEHGRSEQPGRSEQTGPGRRDDRGGL